ncbi:Fur family transcriptional regulator [Roseivirga pacifica]|uniref:Fur family transcriptional regulator n=1 Tax=Roseivirga pacifica TaxID=1267423 RepID=UPI0020951EC6|nr:transcriptional repressor [Roseivirga pacifica]
MRHTQGRADIISVFLNKNVAISHSDIEAEMDSQYDRVTIYRTLKSFLEKGLIHKVLDDTGTMHYALCDDACSEVEHQHDHIHFKCNNCGETTCLENVHIPKVSLPNGFSYEESNYLITGTCDKCN